MYEEASMTLRRNRLLSKNPEMLRQISDGALGRFHQDIRNHLTGRWIRSEVQAGAIRLYVIWRELEVSLGRPGDFHSYCRVVCEQSSSVFNYIRGASGKSRYTSDQLHGWSTLLTRHWLSDGYQVHILLHPSGVIEPLLSQIEGGTLDNSGSK